MTKIFRKLILTILFFYSAAYATEDYYHFSSSTDQKRFNSLTSELRCLVCQNQNLAESNASLAEDLRIQIYEKIKQGQSNQLIINYLVARYGDFILYKPPLNPLTVGLWFAPILILITSITYLLWYTAIKNVN